MKAKTEKLIITKKGTIHTHYLSAITGSQFVGNKIYCKRWQGHKALKDVSHRIKEILKAQGYKFTIGNDAPRGGVEGDFIKCSTVAINFLKGLKNYDNENK